MSFKVLVKIVVFLAILFTILFIGLNNRQSADFYFPGVIEGKWTTQAAIVYFVMFSAGVVAGAVLVAGSGGGGRSKASSKSDK